MPFIKILVLLAHKEDFFRLILYLQRKFLHADYDSYERQIVIGFKRKCTFFIYFFTLFTLATVVSYIVNPLIGKSRSVKIWHNLQILELNSVITFFFCTNVNFYCFCHGKLLKIITLLNIYLKTSYSNVSANIGRNESDRVFPFNMWIDLPLTTTPYYEIIFVLQVLSFHNFITTEFPTFELIKGQKVSG